MVLIYSDYIILHIDIYLYIYIIAIISVFSVSRGCFVWGVMFVLTK